MLPTKEDVNKYERAWEEIKESLRGRLITPEEYKELYDKHNLRELTPKVIGWIGICKHCLRIIQPIYLEDLKKIFDLQKCNEVIKTNRKCYILEEKCQSISKDNKECYKLGGGERFVFLLEYASDIPINKRREYCSEKCRQAWKSRKWRKEHPGAKKLSDKKYLSSLEPEDFKDKEEDSGGF